MTRDDVTAMVAKMKRLPRRHRIAHLRALIAREPVGSSRREQMAVLLGDEMTAPSGRQMPTHELPLDA